MNRIPVENHGCAKNVGDGSKKWAADMRRCGKRCGHARAGFQMGAAQVWRGSLREFAEPREVGNHRFVRA